MDLNELFNQARLRELDYETGIMNEQIRMRALFHSKGGDQHGYEKENKDQDQKENKVNRFDGAGATSLPLV